MTSLLTEENQGGIRKRGRDRGRAGGWGEEKRGGERG
jgi:hypothetical protein